MADEHLNAVVHDGDGPYALLVHGALGSRSYWAENLGALSTVCRPVVVELWGHGASPSPTDLDRYRPESYAAEFERLRQRLGVERWHTIGQSMGAALTLHYGLRHPDRVMAQVITNSSSAFSPIERWQQRHATYVRALIDGLHADGIESVRDHKVNPGRSRRIAASTRRLLAVEFDEHDPIGVAHSLDTTNLHLPLGARLRQVTHPTLMTLGVDETRFVELLAKADRIPDLEVVELAAAHAVNAHDPVGWNQAVTEFLCR